MFCPNCGAKNEGAERQCFVCGKSLPAGSEGGRITPGSPSRAPRPGGPIEVPGSVGDRMIALVIDRVLLVALLSVGVASLGAERGALAAPRSVWSGVLAGLGVAVVILLYHFLLEALMGTTLGKGVMGLQVRFEGERGKFASSAIRNVMRLVDGIGLYLIGFFVALFSPRRRRIGDYLAGTAVVELPVPPFARAALIVTWIVIVAACVWIAGALCADCARVITAGPTFPA
ncbi:MAG TPA: RDD family protein [Thermoanaerobaculia bacterium]|nr:RDD family protein [Thermoanaerobaculia bacterium]